LGATDRAIRLTERFTACFADRRMPELVEHNVGAMVMQRKPSGDATLWSSLRL
jgi:hypothetical protein